MTDRADTIAAKIEAFIRAEVIPCEEIRERVRMARATNSFRNCETRHAGLAC